MSERNNITPSEADLKLARSIDELNQGLIAAEQIDDPLFALLQQHKSSIEEDIPNLQGRAGKVWTKLELAMDQKSGSIHQMPDRSNVRIWAVAATILLLAFTGIFWLVNRDQMQLVGQSGMEMATLNLKDGTEVTLRPHSSLWIKKYTNEEQVYMLDGEALFEVVRNPDRRFSVESGDAIVSVLGTRFILNNWGNTGSVYLDEGSIRFETSDGNSSVVLSAGQSSRILNGAVSEPKTGEADIYNDWLSNTIVLDGQTAAQLFAEMEQHFNISLSSDADIYSDTLGGSIQLESLEQALNDLSLVLGGTFNKTGDNNYRFTPLD
jgi:transmembrane sensor